MRLRVHYHDTFTAAYAAFLQSGNIPPSLEDDIHRLEQLPQQALLLLLLMLLLLLL